MKMAKKSASKSNRRGSAATELPKVGNEEVMKTIREMAAQQRSTREMSAQRTAAIAEMDVDMDRRMIDEVAGDMDTRMAEHRSNGKSQWWNRELCPITNLHEMAAVAMSRREWLDVAIFAAMIHVRTKS
jgi:hypothetical protein